MKHVGDLAAELAEELREEHERAIADDPTLLRQDEDVMTEEKRSILARISFKWRQSDQMLLDRIRVAAEGAFDELFGSLVDIIDNLYASLREVELNQYGVSRTDERGRPVWRTDEQGNYIESWGNLTGQDIDEALFAVTKLRMIAAPKVNDLLMEALLAKRIATDAKDDSLSEMIDGTIQDKTAKANRKTRTDSYHSFFRFWIWSQGDVFLKEVSNFQRVLERVRDRRIYEK